LLGKKNTAKTILGWLVGISWSPRMACYKKKKKAGQNPSKTTQAF